MITTVQMRRTVVAITVAAALTTTVVGVAQMPGDPMNTMPAPMPGTYDPMTGMTPPSTPAPAKSGLKQIFAGTLGLVLQTTGVSAATALSQGLAGAITNWFNKPPKQPKTDPAMGMNSMPAGAGMDMNAMPAPAPGMGGMGAPPASDPAMGGMAMPPAPPPAMPDGRPVPVQPMPPPPPPSLYAGIAFEVHALDREGKSVPVDPATRGFATGERFVVFYRPSLPGQVRVMTVNPRGEEKQIDSVAVAAGELARLGPYEFRDATGEEILRLILVSCRTDALLATTRDIVKVADVPPPAASAPGVPGLAECTQAGTRGVRPVKTRDIAKVETEDGTMFALDPVTQQEISSGSITPREVTIRFRHL